MPQLATRVPGAGAGAAVLSLSGLRPRPQTQNYKEPTDAEDLMPLPTSDVKNPVCMEMKIRHAACAAAAEGDLLGLGDFGGSLDDNHDHLLHMYNSLQDNNANINSNPNSNKNNNNNGFDVGSVGSSGTYVSCRTQPFLSQGDLTDDMTLSCMPAQAGHAQGTESVMRGVRKSASGDTALRSAAAGAGGNGGGGTQGSNSPRGSRTSLSDSPRQQRRARFQQAQQLSSKSGRNKARFEVQGKQSSLEGAESIDLESMEPGKTSRPASGGGSGFRRPSFLPPKGLASSATKIINHHLFGLSSLSLGKNGGSKSSLSAESDSTERGSGTGGEKGCGAGAGSRSGSRSGSQEKVSAPCSSAGAGSGSPAGAGGCATPEPHRRNKSILKKGAGDACGGRSGRGSLGRQRGGSRWVDPDPETEKLISDTASLDSESSPARRPGSGSGPNSALSAPSVAKARPSDPTQAKTTKQEKERDRDKDSSVTPSRLDSKADSRADSRAANTSSSTTKEKAERQQHGEEGTSTPVLMRAAIQARQLKTMFLESGPGAVAVPGSSSWVGAGGSGPGQQPQPQPQPLPHRQGGGGPQFGALAVSSVLADSLDEHSDAENSTSEETRLLRRHPSENGSQGKAERPSVNRGQRGRGRGDTTTRGSLRPQAQRQGQGQGPGSSQCHQHPHQS